MFWIKYLYHKEIPHQKRCRALWKFHAKGQKSVIHNVMTYMYMSSNIVQSGLRLKIICWPVCYTLSKPMVKIIAITFTNATWVHHSVKRSLFFIKITNSCRKYVSFWYYHKSEYFTWRTVWQVKLSFFRLIRVHSPLIGPKLWQVEMTCWSNYGTPRQAKFYLLLTSMGVRTTEDKFYVIFTQCTLNNLGKEKSNSWIALKISKCVKIWTNVLLFRRCHKMCVLFNRW